MPARVWLIFPLLILSACRKPSEETPEKIIPVSYTHEVRPILSEKCLTCHSPASQDTTFLLSLASPTIPDTFSFPHPHKLELSSTEQDTLERWIQQGQKIDPHWSTDTIPTEFSFDKIDAFLSPGSERQSPRPAPEQSIATPENLPALLAGDFSGNPLATEFLRHGEDNPAYRINSVSKRFLGLNLECAQCHHHPSAPITVEDYRHLQSLFTTPYDNSPIKNPLRPPTHFSPAPGHGTKSSQSYVTLTTPETPDRRKAEFQAWLADEHKIPLIPDLTIALSFNSQQLSNLAIQSSSATRPISAKLAAGVHRSAAQFENGTTIEIPETTPTSTRETFTLSFWVKLQNPAGKEVVLLRQGQFPMGFELALREGHFEARFTRYWPGNAMGIRSAKPLISSNRWQHVALSYQGLNHASDFKLYLNGMAVETHSISDNLMGPVFDGTPQPIILGGPSDSKWWMDEFKKHSRNLSPLEIRHLADGVTLARAIHQTPLRTMELWKYFASAFDDSARELRKQNIVAATTYNKAHGHTDTPIMEAIAVPPRETTNSLSASLTANSRLEFANKLIKEDHNLFARATVNDLWKTHFGQALIPHGLGYGGPKPKHLDLLNWLAHQLVESNWDHQKISKLITSSHLYQTDYPAEKEDGLVCPRPMLMKPKIRR